MVVFSLAVKAKIIFAARSTCQMACLYTAGLQPSLTAVNLPVKVTAKQVSAALLFLMVYVNINALISNFCAFHRKTAVFMMSIYTHAPLLIFAEASAKINIFGQGATTRKIFEYIW